MRNEENLAESHFRCEDAKNGNHARHRVKKQKKLRGGQGAAALPSTWHVPWVKGHLFHTMWRRVHARFDTDGGRTSRLTARGESWWAVVVPNTDSFSSHRRGSTRGSKPCAPGRLLAAAGAPWVRGAPLVVIARFVASVFVFAALLRYCVLLWSFERRRQLSA